MNEERKLRLSRLSETISEFTSGIALKFNLENYLSELISQSSDSDEVIIQKVLDLISDPDPVIPISKPPSKIQEIQSIFPDACESYIDQKLKEHHNNITTIIELFVEKGYEKSIQHIPSKTSTSSHSSSSSSKLLDFSSLSSFQPSTTYQQQSLLLLQSDFPFLRLDGLRAFHAQKEFHYWPSRQTIEKELKIHSLNHPYFKTNKMKAVIKKWKRNYEPHSSNQSLIVIEAGTGTGTAGGVGVGVGVGVGTGSGDMGGRDSETTFKGLSLLDASQEGLDKLNLRTKQTPSKPSLPNENDLDPILAQELEFISSHCLEELQAMDREAALQLSRSLCLSVDHGQLLECGCCNVDRLWEELEQCCEGHLVCKECLTRQVETILFGGGKVSVSCIAPPLGESCTAVYLDSTLRSSLPPQTYERFEKFSAQDSVRKAGLDPLSLLFSCHHCQKCIEIAENFTGSVLSCTACYRQTCRLCGRDQHVPLRCEEVTKKEQEQQQEKSNETTRLSVEEAMTEARIRSCPKCKSRFFKTEGCNKMRCSCGTMSCYLCRASIQGYQHFCQTPHCTHKSCGKCPLFTDSLEDDRRAMLEAGMRTLNQHSPRPTEGEGEAKGTGSSSTGPGLAIGVGGGVGVGAGLIDPLKLLEEAQPKPKTTHHRPHQQPPPIHPPRIPHVPPPPPPPVAPVNQPAPFLPFLQLPAIPILGAFFPQPAPRPPPPPQVPAPAPAIALPPPPPPFQPIPQINPNPNILPQNIPRPQRGGYRKRARRGGR